MSPISPVAVPGTGFLVNMLGVKQWHGSWVPQPVWSSTRQQTGSDLPRSATSFGLLKVVDIPSLLPAAKALLKRTACHQLPCTSTLLTVAAPANRSAGRCTAATNVNVR